MLAALRATTEHPTAEMLYNTLKPEYPELSLGTVYRNLSVLAEEGLVVSVAHVNGQERYDARVEPHTHFICRRCARVIDLLELEDAAVRDICIEIIKNLLEEEIYYEEMGLPRMRLCSRGRYSP